MKLRVLSLNEVLGIGLMNFVIGLTLGALLNPVVGIFLLMIALVCLFYIATMKLISKVVQLPGKSMLVSRKMMEIHMGDIAANEFDFFREVARSVQWGISKDCKVVFYTWHVEPQAIMRVLGESVVVKSVTGFEKNAQLILNPFREKDCFSKPLYKAIINPKELDAKSKARIARFAGNRIKGTLK